MKKLYLVLLAGLVFNTAAYATECKVVEDQISEKIKANGVSEFTLINVDKGTATADQKVVGVCDGGKKDIVYTRGKSTTNTPKAEQATE